MPPGPHERPPARACCSQHVHIAAAGRCEPIAPTEPGRTELFELGAPRCCVRATRVLRRQVLEPRRIRSRCLGRSDNGSLRRTCSTSWVLHRGARWRRDRVEKCCLLRTACTVLLDELTWVLHLRVLAQERRRLLQVELALLQVERPDAEDKFRVRARGRRRWTRRRRRRRARRSAATEITFSCCLQHHHRRAFLPVPRAASRRRPSGCHPRASCRVRAVCVPTASAPPGADTSVRGQPHRPRKPRMCQ